MVGVLGHEPVALLVHHDAGDELGRRVERRGDERLLHEPQLGAHRSAEADAEPVVVRRREREQLRAELWGQLLDHRVVADVATGSDHDRPCTDRTALVVPAPGDAHDRAATLGTCLHDQVGRAGLVPHVDVGLRDPLGQCVEHHLGAAGVTGLRHLVPTWRGLRDVAERVHLLVAGEHQALGAGLDHRLLLVERALELASRAPRSSRSARRCRRRRPGSCPRRGRG